MKAQVKARALAQALRRAGKYIGTPKGLPILTQVQLRAYPSCVDLTTTDLDSAYTESIPLSPTDPIHDPGVVQVSCKTLLTTVARHGKGTAVALESNGGKLLQVRNGNRTAALPVTDPDDFPGNVEAPGTATVCSIDAADFARVFRAVAPMVSTDNTRLELCGVNVELTDEGKLTLTGTNGHLLATETLHNFHSPAGPRPCSAIVSPKAILSFFDRKPEGDYELTFWPVPLTDAEYTAHRKQHGKGPESVTRFFEIALGSRVLRVRVMEGPFPDYRRVIPNGEADVTARLEVDAVALGEAVAGVLPASEPTTRQVILETVPHVNGKTTLLLTAESADNGKAQAAVAILRNGEREGIRCGVNGSYMALICKAAGGSSLELEYRSAVAAQLWRAGDYLALLMPLRLPVEADRTEAA